MVTYTDLDKNIANAYQKMNFRKMVFESVVNSVFLETADDEETASFLKWKQEVQQKHPEKKLLFKGRIEKGSDDKDLHTVSAEESGKDRSYGVWDHDERKGHVFESESSGGDPSAYNKWLLAKLGDLPRTKAGYENGVMEGCDDDEKVEEGILDKVKAVGKKVLDTIAPGDDELLKDLKKKAGVSVPSEQPKRQPSKMSDAIKKATAPEDVKFRELDENFKFFGDTADQRFLAKAKELHGEVTKGKKDKDGRTPYLNKDGKEIGFHDIDGEGDHSYDLFKKPHTPLNEDNELAANDPRRNQTKYNVSYDIYHTNREKPLYTGSRAIWANDENEAIDTAKTLFGGMNHRVNEAVDVVDTVTMDVPFLIRVMEFAREDAKSDEEIHQAVEKMINQSKSGTLTMAAYDEVFGKEHEGPDGDNDEDDKGAVTEEKEPKTAEEHAKLAARLHKKVDRLLAGYDDDDDVERVHNSALYHDNKAKELSGKEKLDEVLTASTPIGTWIKDFIESEDPKFEGKSKEERRKMAIGAYYGAQKK